MQPTPSSASRRPQELARNATTNDRVPMHTARAISQAVRSRPGGEWQATSNMRAYRLNHIAPPQMSRPLIGSGLKEAFVSFVAPHTGGHKCRLATMAVDIAGHDKYCRKSSPPATKQAHRHPLVPSEVGHALP